MITSSIKDFLMMVGQIFVDPSFQRPECWEQSDMNSYMQTVMKGQANLNIMIANAEKCRSYCESIGADQEVFYFTKVMEKYGWISVDGNNRSQFFVRFFNDEIEVDFAPGKKKKVDYILKWTDQNGEQEIHRVTLGKHTYSNLPLPVKQYLDSLVINQYHVIEATSDDLREHFRSLNSGSPLSGAELRNSFWSNLAEKVRKLTDKFSVFNSYKFGMLTVKRARDEVLGILWVLLTYMKQDNLESMPSSIGKKLMDDLYQDNDQFENFHLMDSVESTLTKGLEIFTKNLFFISDNLKNHGVHSVGNWVMTYSYLVFNGFKILDPNLLLKSWVAVENGLRSDKTIVFDDGSKTYSFSGCCSAWNKGKLQIRLQLIMESLFKLTNIDDIVVHKDGQRLYTSAQRVEMWYAQGGKLGHINNGVFVDGQNARCPLTDKEIRWSEVQNGKLWHADHKHAHSKGGKTTIENGQLVCAEANLKKSDKVA